MLLQDQYTTPGQSLSLKGIGLRQDTPARWIRKKGEELWELSVGGFNAHNIADPRYEIVAPYSQIELLTAMFGNYTRNETDEIGQSLVEYLRNKPERTAKANERLGPSY